VQNGQVTSFCAVQDWQVTPVTGVQACIVLSTVRNLLILPPGVRPSLLLPPVDPVSVYAPPEAEADESVLLEDRSDDSELVESSEDSLLVGAFEAVVEVDVEAGDDEV
jgi:hypothetical protein